MPHPVHTSRKQPDGCFEVYYFDRLIGWLRQGDREGARRPIWRALSIHGDLRHAHSQASARAALLEMMH
jgi:hypothetical protein